MKRAFKSVFFLYMLISVLVFPPGAQLVDALSASETSTDNRPATENTVSERSGTDEPYDGPDIPETIILPGTGPVWVISVEGTIDLGLASFISRQMAEANESLASVIIFEINTFGGRVDAATEIVDTILKADIPTVAWVTDRAWSAGALIALATDIIWMSPGSSIGAAEPRPADEKTISALKAQFESVAERTGRDPLIAAAMVDARVEVEGLSGPGEILTLTAKQAVTVGYSRNIVSNRQSIKNALDVASRTETVAQFNWAERAARFLTAPVITEILLTLAFLGLIAEVTSPGFGVPGALGLAALVLFFGGRYVVGIVGWEILLLFTLGLFFLLAELLIIPGFGIVGLLGIGSVVGSLILSYGAVELALRSLAIVLIITLIGTVLLWRFGRRRTLWGRLILSQTSPLTGPEAEHTFSLLGSFKGKEGRSFTVLRPAGVVIIEGERFDAVSAGGYIAAGKRIVVIRVDGSRIVVDEVTDEDRR